MLIFLPRRSIFIIIPVTSTSTTAGQQVSVATSPTVTMSVSTIRGITLPTIFILITLTLVRTTGAI